MRKNRRRALFPRRPYSRVLLFGTRRPLRIRSGNKAHPAARSSTNRHRVCHAGRFVAAGCLLVFYPGIAVSKRQDRCALQFSTTAGRGGCGNPSQPLTPIGVTISAGLPPGLRKTCGSFDEFAKGRRSPQKPRGPALQLHSVTDGVADEKVQRV